MAARPASWQARLIACVHTREISAHDVIRILQHGGRLTQLSTLRAQGLPGADPGAARLSACQYRHNNVQGHYSLALPGLGGGRRPGAIPAHPARSRGAAKVSPEPAT